MATAAAILVQWFNGRRTTGTDRSRQVGRGRRWSQFRRAAGSADVSAGLEAAFRKGLGETSYVEGQNVTVEYHWLEGQFEPARSGAVAAKEATTRGLLVMIAASEGDLEEVIARCAILISPPQAERY